MNKYLILLIILAISCGKSGGNAVVSTTYDKERATIMKDDETKGVYVGIEQGMKFDYDKNQMDLIPGEVLEALGRVLTYGANKYAPNNWKLVKKERYVAAMLRHYAAWAKGEKLDKESKLRHLEHMLANVSFLLWMELDEEK